MVERETRFEPHPDDIAAKVIDGELIVIRLSDGSYYATDNVGPHVWALLAAGLAVGDVARTIAAWYDCPAETAAADVTAFVDQLLEEELIVRAARDDAKPAVPSPPAKLDAYETPQLRVYRDMGNLLALDPPTPGIDDLLLQDQPGA